MSLRAKLAITDIIAIAISWSLITLKIMPVKPGMVIILGCLLFLVGDLLIGVDKNE